MRKVGMFLLSMLLVCSQWTILHAEETIKCTTLTDTNEDQQDYYSAASPIRSYLCRTTDGWMRFIVDNGVDGYLVDYFDGDFNVKKRLILEEQLPIFGAFYESDNYYFVVSGQTNVNESDTKGVVRISKYDKQWNHIKDCKISGINTVSPFRAGSVRLDDDGTYLFIRTSHLMYKSNDGYHHQANMTFQIRMSDMKKTDSHTDVANTAYGYVSHSFNQFIKVDGKHIYAVDHGDAYPRSFVLMKYNTEYQDGLFTVQSQKDNIEVINTLRFQGDTGGNYTGAAIGGFEMSDTHYLLAYHSVPQDESFDTTNARNVYVYAVNRETKEHKIYTYTNIKGSNTTSTPQLVKISATRFMLMYEENNQLQAVLIDNEGKRISDVYKLNGTLSDCQPITYNNNIYWFSYQKDETVFYKLNSKTGQLNKKTIDTGHKYTSTSKVTNGFLRVVCDKCKKKSRVACITNLFTWWKTEDDGHYYYPYCDENIDLKQTVDYLTEVTIEDLSDGDIKDEVIIKVSDESILRNEHVDGWGSLTALKAGACVVTFTSKYNPSIKVSKLFHVGDSLNEYKVSNFAVKAIDYNTLKLSWDAVKYAKSYKVYLYDQAKGKNKYIKTVKGTNTTEDVKTGVKYTYRIMPVLKIEDHEFSGKLSRKKSGNTKLSGTVKLSLKQLSGAKIKLEWNRIAGATRYILYRKTENSSYKKVLTMNGSTTTYTSGTLKPANYSYLIKPARYDSISRVYGTKSNEVKVKAYVDKPVVKVEKKTSTSITISWGKVAGVEKYQVYRKKSAKGTYKMLFVTTNTGVEDTNLSANISYFYKVRGYTKVGQKPIFSKYSVEKVIKL